MSSIPLEGLPACSLAAALLRLNLSPLIGFGLDA